MTISTAINRAAAGGSGVYSMGIGVALAGAGLALPPDADALAYIARMSTVPTAEQADAYDYFVKQAKSIGAWPYITDCGFLCAQDAVSARLGVKNAINLSLVGTAPEHYPGYGTRGNGSSQAYDTGYKFPAGQQDNAHMGVYSLTSSGSNASDIGNANSAINCRSLGTADTAFSRVNGATAGSATSLDGLGIFIANRTGALSADNKMWKRGAVIQASTSASAVPDATYNLWVAGRNGATPEYSGRTMAFWTIGTGMPDAVLTAYSLLIENVCARLSASYTAANVTDKTRALYRYMTRMARQPSYVLGAFDNAWWALGTTPNLLDDIATITSGKVPALIAHDFADPLSIGGAAGSAAQIARIKAHYAAGGIVTVQMHPGNPVTGSFEQLPSLAGTPGNQYDMTGNPVVACLTGGAKRAEFLAYTDRIIAFLQACTDASGAPIPIILRPWHEINGGFFWWTDPTPANTIQLWRDFVDRIKAAGVQNVLYSWNNNFSPTPSATSYFPGLEYVDLLSADYYENVSNPTGLSLTETVLNGLISSNFRRPVYLGEIGFQGAADTNAGLWPTKVGGYHRDRLSRSASFLLWRSTFGPSAGGATNAEFASMVADTACITRDRLVDVYTVTAGPAPIPTPVLSAPTDVASGAAGGLLTVTTTGNSGTLYWFVSTSATPPTAANLKAGTGATKFGSLPVTATGAQSATVAGLAVSTLYYAHFIHTNGGGDSNIVTGDGFTTAAYPTFASVTGFGDSMMAGSAATVDANRFLNLFTTATGGGTVRNSGIGATVLQNSNDMDGVPRANNGRDRWQAATAGANLSEALLHSYGYNDMRYTGAPATFNATSFENDYNEIIAANIASGYARSKIYLNTPFWVTDFILANSVTPGFAAGTRAQVLDYASACLRVARDWGVRFADVYTATTGRTDLIDADGVHPNNAGHLFYKDLLLAGRILNPRTATSGTLAGGVETLTMPITDPGDSPISYSVRVLDSNYVMGSVVTQAGGSFSLTGVAAGTYRVMHRANYADGTSTPWAVSGTAAVTSASGDAAITDILATRTQAIWIDPSDLATLFQDTAGTVPVTAAGQFVAKWNDKSGFGNHLTQSNTAKQPTYQIVGGKPCVLFSKARGDFMQTAGSIVSGSDKAQIFVGLRKLSDAASAIAIEFGTGTVDSTTYISAPSATGANSYRYGSAGSGQQVAGTGVFAAAPDTSVVTGLGDIAAPSAQLRRNGAVVETNTASQGTGTYGTKPVYVGARSGTSLQLDGYVFGAVMCFGANLTGTQVSDAEAWMNGKTGAY